MVGFISGIVLFVLFVSSFFFIPKLISNSYHETRGWVFYIASFLSVLVVSGYLLIKGGLNLYVYGTVDKPYDIYCSQDVIACKVPSTAPTFWGNIMKGDIPGAFNKEFTSFQDTLNNVPDRFKNWDVNKYIPSNATYYSTYNSNKKTALEILDPGCVHCKQFFKKVEKTGFANRYNFTYIPIALEQNGKLLFKNSGVVVKYLYAVRDVTPAEPMDDTPVDWQILKHMYTDKVENGSENMQYYINELSEDDAVKIIHSWLAKAGYTKTQIAEVDIRADGEKVSKEINQGNNIIINKIKAEKTPTLIFNGRKYSGAIPIGAIKK